MDTLKHVHKIVNTKPYFFVATTLIYFAIIILLKWHVSYTLNTLWFVVGGIIGIYLIDVVEAFINIQPSPFRSSTFCYLFVVVSFFVVSSSGSIIASGLVLSMYLTLLLWQSGQLKLINHLDNWYRTPAGPLPYRTQVSIFSVFVLIFLLETFLFIQQFPS